MYMDICNSVEVIFGIAILLVANIQLSFSILTTYFIRFDSSRNEFMKLFCRNTQYFFRLFCSVHRRNHLTF